MQSENYIRFFEEISIEDIPLVGGKNASLGEMVQILNPVGVLIPNGFAITANAYRALLSENQLWDKLHNIIDPLEEDNLSDLAARGRQARQLIYEAPLPDDLINQIHKAYQKLTQQFDTPISLAIRSSATAEDLPTASFAGQQDTYLNIEGEAALLEACKKCFASLFTDRAIHYRIDQGFNHFDVGLSIGVQKMVRSDLAASGVMFSIDTETGFKDAVFITGALGLGENVVQGAVDPDEFYVHKPTFEQGYRQVLRRHLGAKKMKMIYAHQAAGHPSVRNVVTTEQERQAFCISDSEVLKLADYAIRIEKHYSGKSGQPKPMDIEWAKDGVDGQLYIVQARPETVVSQTKGHCLTNYQITPHDDAQILVSGRAVGAKVAQGQAHVIQDVAYIAQFKPGEILVTDITTPDWEPVMKMASAIITNRGGRTCHAAIIARELGIPAIVGCAHATSTLVDNPFVTVSCAGGDTGNVYLGKQPYEIIETDLSNLEQPKTKMMLNLANPDLAFQSSFIPNQGVGLARMEFIINETVKAHPLALCFPEKITDPDTQEAIAQLTQGYPNGGEFFIDQLASGIGTIAAAFYPKPVVVRLSDFKSNEYAQLLGGKDFEPTEANPMIGYRGAARYLSPAYEPAFILECQALKKVREDMGFTNVILMIPFVRQVEEARKVIDLLAKHGLKRHQNDLKIYMMCEIPNNVIEIDAFAPYFDGISIGSNDLTQLVLGVDRDSELVANDFDERAAGVKTMIHWAIEGAKRNGLHSGLCGQAPSDYPEMAEFLVQLGIDSISLNPDSMLTTTQKIVALEKSLSGTS